MKKIILLLTAGSMLVAEVPKARADPRPGEVAGAFIAGAATAAFIFGAIKASACPPPAVVVAPPAICAGPSVIVRAPGVACSPTLPVAMVPPHGFLTPVPAVCPPPVVAYVRSHPGFHGRHQARFNARR